MRDHNLTPFLFSSLGRGRGIAESHDFVKPIPGLFVGSGLLAVERDGEIVDPRLGKDEALAVVEGTVVVVSDEESDAFTVYDAVACSLSDLALDRLRFEELLGKTGYLGKRLAESTSEAFGLLRGVSPLVGASVRSKTGTLFLHGARRGHALDLRADRLLVGLEKAATLLRNRSGEGVPENLSEKGATRLLYSVRDAFERLAFDLVLYRGAALSDEPNSFDATSKIEKDLSISMSATTAPPFPRRIAPAGGEA